MDIYDIIKLAFETANLIPSDYDVSCTVGEKTANDTEKHYLTIQSLRLPSRKVTIEFEIQEDTYVLDVYVSQNTLFEGQEFKDFFWTLAKPDHIRFS